MRMSELPPPPPPRPVRSVPGAPVLRLGVLSGVLITPLWCLGAWAQPVLWLLPTVRLPLCLLPAVPGSSPFPQGRTRDIWLFLVLFFCKLFGGLK